MVRAMGAGREKQKGREDEKTSGWSLLEELGKGKGKGISLVGRKECV